MGQEYGLAPLLQIGTTIYLAFWGEQGMGSQPQDQATQTAASAGAQSAASVASQNAATAQNNANSQISTLFGTYNPSTNQYTGGTESQYLNPSSMTTNGLTGSFANLYNTQANTNATGANNSVKTAQMNADSNGMGATPNGYTADQVRQAYQEQAQNNATNYSTDFGNQNTQQVNLYDQANTMLANSANQNQNSATANNNTAAGTNTSLYSTASTPVPTALGTVLGTVGTLAGAGASAYATSQGKPGCWVAAEIFGGWHEPRTELVREWLFEDFSRLGIGRVICDLYMRHGERVAESIRAHRWLRWIFTKVCNAALEQAARSWEMLDSAVAQALMQCGELA